METSPSFESCRVLYVDDEPDLAATVAAMLERKADDVGVETAASPSEGLSRLEAAEFDCLVSDFEMPEMDGIELLRTVRERFPDLPFILFTGQGSETVASDAFAAGATDYIQKGTTSEQYERLAKRVENAIVQYRSERRAEETERRIQELTEATDDFRWMFDGSWEEVIYVNSAYEDIWGRSTDAIRSDPRDLLKGVHPDDRSRVEEAMAALSDGKSVDLDCRVNAEEGYDCWVWLQGEPIHDEFGSVARITGFARDITDRKAREQELQQNRNLVTALSTALPDYIFIYDADGTYLDVITGWAGGPVMHTPEELIGQSVDDIVSEESASIIMSAIADALETDSLQTIEYTVGTEYGPYWYEAHVAPIPEGYDGSEAVILTARDVTERKQDERELQRQNERLEQFATVVSHDLRNPLNVAQGRLELAQDEVENEQLDAAADALDRIQALVDDLLTLARQGDKVSDTQVVSLASIVEGCWQNVEAGSATLQTDSDQRIRADPGRLKQLVENLFRNAVEHGGNAVTVTVGDLEDGFYVADDGPGIPESKRDDVFESGFTTTDSGTGFGLSITQEIVEAHDWAIAITDSDATGEAEAAEAERATAGGARFEITGVESV